MRVVTKKRGATKNQGELLEHSVSFDLLDYNPFCIENPFAVDEVSVTDGHKCERIAASVVAKAEVSGRVMTVA